MRYAIVVLAIGGIAVLCFALAGRYDAPVRPIDLLHVNWNSAYVNQSPDAEVYGVPLAAVGILGYVLLVALVLLDQKVLTVYWSGILLFYGLYLTNIEARILYVWCEYWVSSLILIVLIAFLAVGDLIW
jgi:vitamin-K-epoxide reductase (warfarin-sensitive)